MSSWEWIQVKPSHLGKDHVASVFPQRVLGFPVRLASGLGVPTGQRQRPSAPCLGKALLTLGFVVLSFELTGAVQHFTSAVLFFRLYFSAICVDLE